MKEGNFGEVLAEFDLKTLKYTEDKELFELIKVEHPKWLDENINRQMQDMRSPEFAEWYTNLLKEANDERI